MTAEFNTQYEVSLEFVLFCYTMLGINPDDESQEDINEAWESYIADSAEDYADGNQAQVSKIKSWDTPLITWVREQNNIMLNNL